MSNIIVRYAEWAEKQTSYQRRDPMLIEFTKSLVLLFIPMILILVLAFIFLMVIGAILIQVIPWIWEVVWI